MSIVLPENEPIFPIRTAARLLHVSVHTLRMYEKEGLIVPFKKKSSHRLYSKADLERLECIRHAINKSKISIAGIKSIYALIPCWKINECKESAACPAFAQHAEPCWNVSTKCKLKKNCRDCDIYLKFATCSTIKNGINSLLRTN